VPDGTRPSAISDDVQAAVYVLGRMPLQNGPLDMRNLYLVGADLRSLKQFKGADFSGAQLLRVNFSSADLSGAVFAGTPMADYDSDGKNDFSDGVVRKWETEPWERVNFVTLFNWATLINSTFKGTSVSGASFENADLANAKFIEVNLSRAHFQNARN